MSDFNPDWASPPGDTIREMLNERRLSTMWLATRIARPFSRMVGLLAGREPLDEELAAALAVAIGGSKEFWMKRELHYRQALASDAFERELP
jgi:HTH-type transcriptional regulator/antitoxin HigA